jgi:RND family efflux transporter MFP subunit
VVRWGLLLGLLAVVAAGGALAYFAWQRSQSSGSKDEEASQAGRPETPTVTVAKPTRQTVRRLVERPGYNVEAYERTPLYALISGYVRVWNADMGDCVCKGEVLAELYVPDREEEVKQKKAAVRQATSEIDQAKAAVQRAQAENKRARSQHERLAKAGRGGFLDKEQVEEALLGYEAAEAAVAKANADVSVAEARLEVTKADRDHAQALLDYAKVRAPFDGVVTRRNINTGDLVQPASKGEPLFVVERVDPVRVFVNVPDVDAVWVRDGDAATLRVQGLQGQQFKGTVTRTSGALHPQNRTLRTEIDLPNADGKLKPGAYVNATIIVERKEVRAIPAKAVVTQGEQSFCYRVEKGKTLRTPIQTGLIGSDLAEVLKKQTKPARPGEEGHWEDFTGDELIVTSDPAALSDGQAVKVAEGEKK